MLNFLLSRDSNILIMDYPMPTFPIPPPPATQAHASATFSPPPLDGSMLVPDIYDWHLRNSPCHPLFVYDDEEGAENIIHWSTAVRAVHRGGRIIQTRVARTAIDGKTPVVAILASAGELAFVSFF